MDEPRKLDAPQERWDRLFAPSSCLVVITTVDDQGRPNAAAFGTCTRVCHDPVYISFTVGAGKDTYRNIISTGEFVVNIPAFDRDELEKTYLVGHAYPPDVNELDAAGLMAIPSTRVAPPRILEFGRHFECVVDWTKEWEYRLTVVGRVVAASHDRDVVDDDGFLNWERAKPAHYCGLPYHSSFVAAYDVMSVRLEDEPPRVRSDYVMPTPGSRPEVAPSEQ